MKAMRYLALSLMILILSVGCGKKPVQEIESTQSTVNAVISEGLGKYAPEDEKKLKDALAAAMEEIKIQDGKTFKNYDKAKQMLAEVKKNAEEMKAALPAKKEQAKQNALSALESAKTAVSEAKALLAKAPKGKGTVADIQALREDVKGLENSLAEISGLIEKEEFGEAGTKANALKEKASGVSDQIRQALEKVKGAKPAKK
ncbi:MAG: hypothetical protein ACUVTN_11285 [Thermodesulfobacteriota bacterium]